MIDNLQFADIKSALCRFLSVAQKGWIVESNVRKLAQIRAAFVMRGTSFNAWCRENKIVRRTAEQAINGENRSENAQKLAQRIIDEAGIVCINAGQSRAS